MKSTLNLPGAMKPQQRTPEGVSIVQGEVLGIEHNNYLVKKHTGDVLHLYLDDYTQVIGKVRPGDRVLRL